MAAATVPSTQDCGPLSSTEHQTQCTLHILGTETAIHRVDGTPALPGRQEQTVAPGHTLRAEGQTLLSEARVGKWPVQNCTS